MVLRLPVRLALAFGVLCARAALAQPSAPPPGYLFTNVSVGIGTTAVQNINQMVFKPGDTTHVYATRGFSRVITRYDYSPAGQLSNPVNVFDLNSIADSLKTVSGIGFHGDDLWVTRWPGFSNPRPGTISRLRDADHNGSYESMTDYISGTEMGLHTINQIQIVGDTLYTSIGTQTNTGDPAVEQVYNGTIIRMANLNNPQAVNLGTTAGRTTFADGSVLDGTPRRYAAGMRNPFGIRVFNGELWVTDNGQDPRDGATPSSDFMYRDLHLGDYGQFPVVGNPGAPASPVAALADLGSRVAATGFDFIQTGPDAGKLIVGFSSSQPAGHRLALVNPATGGVSSFITGLNTITDVVPDPYGRLLVSDHSGNVVYLLSPPPNGDANLDRKVDIADLGILAQHWQSSGTWATGDFDRNGFVNIADLAILATNWQVGVGAPAARDFEQALATVGLKGILVPDPSAGAIAVIVFLAIRLRRPTPGRFLSLTR